MRKCDVDNFKTRSEAVYGTIALDFMKKRLDECLAKPTDAVSLIEMNEDGTLVFEREPLTNVLFNKIANRRLTARPVGHGNYLPALEEADNVLSGDLENSTCVLVLFFLLDGRPSDADCKTQVPTRRNSPYSKR